MKMTIDAINLDKVKVLLNILRDMMSDDRIPEDIRSEYTDRYVKMSIDKVRGDV